LNGSAHREAAFPQYPRLHNFPEKSRRALHDTFVTAASDSTLKWEVQLRKGCVELAVLASLWDSRLYGLQILRQLEYFSGLRVSEGTIYPLLTRLATAGWVEAEWEDSSQGHPRRYYTLTESGKSRVLEMARSWSKLASNIDRLLARLDTKPVEVPILAL